MIGCSRLLGSEALATGVCVYESFIARNKTHALRVCVVMNHSLPETWHTPVANASEPNILEQPIKSIVWVAGLIKRVQEPSRKIFKTRHMSELIVREGASPLTVPEQSTANSNSFEIAQKTAFEVKGRLYTTGKVIQRLFIVDLYT